MEFVLPDWFYRGVLDRSLVLAIDPAYFHLTGGIERWLYRVARKHAGRQPGGWLFEVAHLHEKSGSLARQTDFALDLRRIAGRQPLPGYRPHIERHCGHEWLHILPTDLSTGAVDNPVVLGHDARCRIGCDKGRRFYARLLVSPHQEEGNVAVYIISDKTSPTVATLRVRVLSFEGAVLSDKSQPVQIAPLASKVYVTIPMLDITNLPNCDLDKVFAVTDLVVDNKVISTNELFFVLKKDMQLPPAKITSELTPSAASNVCSPPLSPSVGDRVGSNTYTLHLSSPVLARSVYISFGNLDAKLADNYFDLLPGQPTDLTITSAASLDDLKASMRQAVSRS